MESLEIIKLANDLMRQHMPNHVKLGWRFEFNNRKRSFGLCNYRTQTIELSNHYAFLMKEESIKDTLLHEIAHALTPSNGHGSSWRSKYIELGGKGTRTSSVEEKILEENISKIINKAKYIYECPACKNQIPFHRKTKTEKYCLCNRKLSIKERTLILLS